MWSVLFWGSTRNSPTQNKAKCGNQTVLDFDVPAVLRITQLKFSQENMAHLNGDWKQKEPPDLKRVFIPPLIEVNLRYAGLDKFVTKPTTSHILPIVQ